MSHIQYYLQTDDIQDDEDDDEHSEDEDEDREEFKNNLDKNGDGRLDKEEIKAWIIPDDYNHVEEESRHLIREADANEVCVLQLACLGSMWWWCLQASSSSCLLSTLCAQRCVCAANLCTTI